MTKLGGKEMLAFRRIGIGWLILLLSVGLLVSSCGDDDDDDNGGSTGTTYTAEELNTMGWESFTLNDFYDALDYFAESVSKKSDLPAFSNFQIPKLKIIKVRSHNGIATCFETDVEGYRQRKP